MDRERGDRSFTVITSAPFGGRGGRYIAREPLDAARKAARVRFADNGNKQTRIMLQLEEITRGQKKKTFFYRGVSKKLDKPKVYTLGGKKVVQAYETEVSALPEDEIQKFLKQK